MAIEKRISVAVLILLAPAAGAADAIRFDDATARSGIAFRHQKSGTPAKHLIESVGGGVAAFDYDGDGLLDLYFVNGADLTNAKPGAAPSKSDTRFWNRLYRNLGGFRFEDVTERAGVAGRGYGMGAAAADFDRDGRVDLYVTNLGANILYRNRGDGTFEDVTARARVAGGGWSSSAGWMDLDGDTWPDLVVARYVEWDFPDIWCGAREPATLRSYCHPDQFKPATHFVFRNKRDGTFERSEWKAGKGLGVAFEDYDGDGRIDVAIANDAFPQQLFRNLGGWRFAESALEMNAAYDDDGRVFSGMGLDFADFDNDGRPDLFINALAGQRYALFRNAGGAFDYVSGAAGVAAVTRTMSGWGAKLADFDNDGLRDLFVAQGHVMDNIHLTQPGLRYMEPPLLMRNTGGRFTDATAAAGEPLRKPMAARGAAFADLDNDGWLDVVISTNDGAPVLLRNLGGSAHWLGVDAPLGSRVRVTLDDGSVRTGLASTAGSYLASNDPRVFLGLGAHAVTKLEVGPPGSLRVVEAPGRDRVVRVR